MRSLVIISFFLVFYSCSTTHRPAEAVITPVDGDYLLNETTFNSLVSARYRNLECMNDGLEVFNAFLDAQSNDSLTTIPVVIGYIEKCIPVNASINDSVLQLFRGKFYRVANRFTDSLESHYPQLITALENDSSTEALTALRDNLHSCGLGIYQTEGFFYVDALPEYFYNNFHKRVSPAMKQFLAIRKNELEQGFSEDAGMTITFDSLYARIVNWEKFLSQYGSHPISHEANIYHEVYLETLLTGMDNSRVFDLESQQLLQEMKLLYERIISEQNELPCGKIVSDYYDLLSRHNFSENDSIASFLTAHGLVSMLGVQPFTR